MAIKKKGQELGEKEKKEKKEKKRKEKNIFSNFHFTARKEPSTDIYHFCIIHSNQSNKLSLRTIQTSIKKIREKNNMIVNDCKCNSLPHK